MAKLPGRGLATAAILFVVDQLIKWVVTGPMDLHMLGDVREIVSFFNLRFVPNYGISLGLLTADSNASRWALLSASAKSSGRSTFFMPLPPPPATALISTG